MQETTIDDRKKELDALLTQIREHPEKPFKAQRERVGVLQNMLAAYAKASA